MKRVTILSLLLLTKTYLISAPTYNYIVWLSSISNLTQYSSKGYLTNSQPMQNTSILIAPNTNFALLQITPINQTQKNFLDLAVANGFIKLIHTSEIISEYSPRTGDTLTFVRQSTVSTYPSEFYQIIKSS